MSKLANKINDFRLLRIVHAAAALSLFLNRAQRVRKTRHIRSEQSFGDWCRDLLLRHETLYFLVWKDLKVQYGNFILGVFWSVFQPLLYFGLIYSVHRTSFPTAVSEGTFYPVSLFAGIIIWNFFTSVVNGVLTSIQSNASSISMSFFPRYYLVLAPAIRCCIDLGFSLILLFCMVIYFKTNISLDALWSVPISAIVLVTTSVGIASLAAVAVVRNRHFRQVIPVLLYAGLFFLPVFYTMGDLGNGVVQKLYSMNPLATSIHLLRFGLGVANMDNLSIFWAIPSSVVLLISGIYAFRHLERTIADSI